MLKIKYFLRFSIAKNRPKYKKNHQLGVYISFKVCKQYVEGCFKKSNFIFSL